MNRKLLWVAAAVLLSLIVVIWTWASGGFGKDTGAVLSWLQWHWKFTYLVWATLVCVSLAVWFGMIRKTGVRNAQQAAATWGSVAFALFFFFFLGAAENTKDLLKLFSFGAVGAALGYLTGVWLAPATLSEESRFAKAQTLIASVAAGAFGTKLLSVADALIDGKENALILRPEYYLPVLSFIAAYLVALAAFYTLRTLNDGLVRVTPVGELKDVDGKKIGLAAGQKVQFAGAANFPDDVSVSWSLKCTRQPEPAGGPSISATGELTVPDAAWMTGHADFLDWAVIAISNLDPSKAGAFQIHLLTS